MKKLVIAVIFLTVLCLGSQALAGNWYVDNTATGTNAGTSWANAWTATASIKWASVACGDTIYMSGGPTGSSKTYPLLWVGKSCTEGSPLTITVGTDSGHNGTVKLIGTPGYFYGIQISNKNWITIDGQSNNDGQRHIEIYQEASCSANNCVNTGISVGGTSVGIKLKYIYLHDVGRINNDYTTAIKFGLTNATYATNHEIAYNYIEKTIDCINVGLSGGIKPTSFGGVKIHHNYLKCYDDGIQTSISTDIYDNTITRDSWAASGYGHPDGIQVYGSYVRIYNNLFTGFLDQPSGNSAIYWEPDGAENMDHNEHQPSDFWVYNNVFYETGTASTSVSAIMLGLGDSRFTSLKRMYILNNTFNGAYNLAFVQDFSKFDKSQVQDFYIMNNLFYNSGNYVFALPIPQYVTTPVDFGGYGSGASVIFDFNSVYSSTGAKVSYLGKIYYTYPDFMAAAKNGIQSHGVAADPLVDPTTLKLKVGSPCIAAGTNMLQYSFSTDKDGVTRSSWEIGAYAHTPTTPTVTQPTTTTSTTETTSPTTTTTTTTTKKRTWKR